MTILIPSCLPCYKKSFVLFTLHTSHLQIWCDDNVCVGNPSEMLFWIIPLLTRILKLRYMITNEQQYMKSWAQKNMRPMHPIWAHIGRKVGCIWNLIIWPTLNKYENSEHVHWLVLSSQYFTTWVTVYITTLWNNISRFL